MTSCRFAGQELLRCVSSFAERIQKFDIDIVPFPHGSELIGMTQVNFDLSKAQQPILGFPGNHTFVMSVVDQKGCSKDVTIVMNVPDYASQN